jgi:hypothetical protein
MKKIVERYQMRMYQVKYEVYFEMMDHEDWVRNDRSRQTCPNDVKKRGDDS